MYHPGLGDGLGVVVALASLVHVLCWVLPGAHVDISSGRREPCLVAGTGVASPVWSSPAPCWSLCFKSLVPTVASRLK